MKYLFIILIPFTFTGCNKEEVVANKTIYASYTLLTNPYNVYSFSGSCNGITSDTTDTTGLYLETTITTDTEVITCFPATIGCEVSLVGEWNGITHSGPYAQVEINLYVNDQLFGTTVVTGEDPGHDFIIE